MKAKWTAILIAVVGALIVVGTAADVVAFVIGQTSAAFALLGDVLIFAGLAVSYLIFRIERSDARQRDVASVLTMLKAVRAGILQWGDEYFENGYDEQGAITRAQQDSDFIMGHVYGQVFHVPVEPLTALIEQPGERDLVRKETIEAANVALWRIGVFNQFVRQQSDFNVQHLAEITDPHLPMARRRVLAASAQMLSTMLHLQGIGGAPWYHKLKDELAANITELEETK